MNHSSPADRFVGDLRNIVGPQHVLTRASAMRRYVRGFRYGSGTALAVVRPGNLVEYWKVLERCVIQGMIVISQASNTGLTGGSTPSGDGYDRQVVVVNTMRIKGLQFLGGGRQVIALPGTTLNELETALEPLGREPHSVIGSSCLGASVIGGVCNNSGGSLIKRGPAYTELSLYAKVDEEGNLRLVNNLGIRLAGTPVEVLQQLQRRAFGNGDVAWDGVASDQSYRDDVRGVEASTPARFNADTRKMHGASGSAGKLAVFAVRLDTFESEGLTDVFYIGTNNAADLTEIRRRVLTELPDLPIAGEYIHREAFNVAEKYGKDTYLLVKWLGTRRLPGLFAAKSRLDAFFECVPLLPSSISDRLLQFGSALLPPHLPRRLRDFRDRYEHHLMLKVQRNWSHHTRGLLQEILAASGSGDLFLCSPEEGKAAFLHRFATAGAAIRYSIMHRKQSAGIVALDIALPRNTRNWVEELPEKTASKVTKRLYYGHFFCHVFHQDYIVAPGNDWLEVEHELLGHLAQRGAKYPAEHNFGHLYEAPADVIDHYRSLDPCNCFNPGVGQASQLLRWKGQKLNFQMYTNEEDSV
ncbi:D-lactate dehydrogenase [Agrobacterium tumefaciens]|uniref:D-lactate dehydrogenase n=1 Tax=Agrobacterium tumefaciens TaxID=358 RepID=UPI001EEDAE60|nr:D-lactate dehydrogenase [Agrobacterium tumefaciens]